MWYADCSEYRTMFRILIVAALLSLGGCASSPRTAVVVATGEPSDELGCMADCLENTDGTCESCAERCLERSDPPTLVTLGR